MKQEITVSVVIPVYNAGRLLQRAVDSALNQYGNMEILIVDDSSTDGIGQVVRKYAGNPKVRYIRNKQNMGVAYARNRGVRMAKGEYIAFLDADDWWEPGKIHRQLDVMERTGSVMSYTGRYIWRNRRRKICYFVPDTLELRELLQCNYIACSSVMIRRSVALEFPMQEGKGIHEDYLTWIRVLKKYGRIYGVPELFLNYYVHRDSRSGKKVNSMIMRVRTYKEAGIGMVQSVRYSFGYYLEWISGLRKEMS